MARQKRGGGSTQPQRLRQRIDSHYAKPKFAAKVDPASYEGPAKKKKKKKKAKLSPGIKAGRELAQGVGDTISNLKEGAKFGGRMLLKADKWAQDNIPPRKKKKKKKSAYKKAVAKTRAYHEHQRKYGTAPSEKK